MTLKGHFDGKVVILDEPPPAELQPNTRVTIAPVVESTESEQVADGPSEALLRIAARARDMGLPADFSEQHDHYIHGTPKR